MLNWNRKKVNTAIEAEMIVEVEAKGLKEERRRMMMGLMMELMMKGIVKIEKMST